MYSKLLAVVLLIGVFSMQTVAQKKQLKVGDKAPDFTSKDQDGKKIRLKDFKGKKVVLYFYPKDQTPGCTKEACSLRDNFGALTDAGYTILGVSSDDEASHKEFINKYSLPFTLIADTDKSVHNKYGVWVEKEREGKKFWGTARTTFIINEKGIITEIIDKVDTEGHANQILKI